MAVNPPGFDPVAFRTQILEAMLIGEPPNDEDKPTFLFAKEPVWPPDLKFDIDGRPLDPTARPVSETGPDPVRIPVAVEFSTASSDELPTGYFRATKVTLTILDQTPDGTPLWDQVKDATDVVLGGDKYMLAFRPPVLAMGEVTIYQVVAFARQET